MVWIKYYAVALAMSACLLSEDPSGMHDDACWMDPQIKNVMKWLHLAIAKCNHFMTFLYTYQELMRCSTIH